MNGRTDPGEIALQEVIGGARLHATDRGLLVHRPGDDQEGDTGGALPGQRERGHAVEAGEGVVREDQVGAERLQRVQELVTTLHPSRGEGNAGALQLVLDELGVHGHVFEDEDAKGIVGHCKFQWHAIRVGGRRRSPYTLG